MVQETEDNPALKPTAQKTQSGLSYLARQGSGPSVVFLHGIGSNAASFLPVLEHLPDHLNLIMWNAPGYQGSDRADDPWPVPETYADSLDRFLTDLDLSSAFLVGHSLGALIATAFARKYPERVKGLVLASAARGYGVARCGQLPAKVRARIDDLAKLGPVDFSKARSSNLVHDPARNASVVAKVQAAMAEIDPAGYLQAVHLLASGDLPEDLAHVPICPGFILGAEDRITPIDQTIAAAKAWESTHGQEPPLCLIEAAGHAVYLQKPREFCTALMQFLPDKGACAPRAAQHNEEM